MSVYAVGDIHGCPEQLGMLLTSSAPGRHDTGVFLADYVDRGPGSIAPVRPRQPLSRDVFTIVFLPGNHDGWSLGSPGDVGRHRLLQAARRDRWATTRHLRAAFAAARL